MDVEKLVFNIKKYLETKEEQLIDNIIDEKEPLLKKYARKLYYLEYEDCIQELRLAVYISILKIKYIDNDYECFSYLVKCVKHRFFKLYELSKNQKDILDNQINIDESVARSTNHEMDNMMFYSDLEISLKTKDEKERKIIVLLLSGYSDKEIGNNLHVSRQYINRMKKRIIQY